MERNMTATTLSVESDERGFELLLETEEVGTLFVNIQGIDLDAFYDQVKARIGPYLRERDEARLSANAWRYGDAEGYLLSDPKHPQFHSVHADIWDARDGK
jgi:hypothetical protein